MKFFTLTILFLSIPLVQGCGSDPDNEDNARAIVWQFVEEKLNNPNPLKFGPCEMKFTPRGGWKTMSYVDTKDRFGKTQRLYFQCEVKYNSNDKWNLVSLNFKRQ